MSAGLVRGDVDQLSRLVRNLLENAVRHAHHTVTVALSEQDDRVQLDIIDDGPGVPEAWRERVFERFARLDESRTRREGGTGLGLAIVREVAHAHHGRVCIVPSETGAHFAVTFPVADPTSDTGAPRPGEREAIRSAMAQR